MPYAMAFVDVRMPPGIDGIETTVKIWEVAPDTQIVICTAYSDYSWDEMIGKVGYSDKLVLLKKPFDNVEVLQLACAMTEKWRLAQEAELKMDQLERMVTARTAELRNAVDLLQQSLTNYNRTEQRLRRSEERCRPHHCRGWHWSSPISQPLRSSHAWLRSGGAVARLALLTRPPRGSQPDSGHAQVCAPPDDRPSPRIPSPAQAGLLAQVRGAHEHRVRE